MTAAACFFTMDNNYNPKKGANFQRVSYRILRFFAGWFFRIFTNYKPERSKKIKAKTFLLIANHTVDLDPIYVVLSIRRHARFVGSANIMRGFPGCFVKWLAGPIPRYKGAPADEVTDKIKANLREGISVITFPEGNTTWDGETGYISPKIAKLAKKSGAALVTFTHKGGYLKKPRWAKYDRKGKVWGSIVNEYSAETLAEMSEEEVYETIKRDLYVNAYEEQEKVHYTYKGKRRAEGLEGPLYLCPSCGRIGSLKTFDNGIYCDCGLNFFYNEEGWLENCRSESSDEEEVITSVSEDLAALASKQKISVLEWAKLQKAHVKDNAESYKKMVLEPIFEDECTAFSKNNGTERDILAENAKIRFFGDRLEIGGKVFALEDIKEMSVFRGKRVFFSCADGYYELEFPESKASQKYLALWRVCSGKAYY